MDRNVKANNCAVASAQGLYHPVLAKMTSDFKINDRLVTLLLK
jgi:hypothetical protein